MYAVVDVETTGGSPVRNRIIEIAILRFDGNKILKRFQHLIRPSGQIPPQITRLTGINNAMVQDAPRFSELAEIIDHYTKDCVFVAHNVNFDYGFLREEYARIGKVFRRKKLCTVRLSRKLLPKKISYSLGKLCESENISISERHRAMGDAAATCELLKKLIFLDQEGWIAQSIKRGSLESFLPPHCPKKAFEDLPQCRGLYYFFNQRKQVVYVGMAKNIRERVRSHFSGLTNTKGKYHFMKSIYDVKARPIRSELILPLLEAIEIKKHWPIFNRSLKRITLNYGVFNYQDRNGYQRLSYAKCGKFDHPLKAFKNLSLLRETLMEMCKEFELCPRLIGLQPLGAGKCSFIEDFQCRGACLGKESVKSYNRRFEEAINLWLRNQQSYFLCDRQKDQNKKAVVFIEKGRVKGYSENLDLDKKMENTSEIVDQLQAVYDDQDLLWIVENYKQKTESTEIVYLET